MIEKQCKRHTGKLKLFAKTYISMFAVIILCSCGNKGDLYLPDEVENLASMKRDVTDSVSHYLVSDSQTLPIETNIHYSTIKSQATTLEN